MALFNGFVSNNVSILHQFPNIPAFSTQVTACDLRKSSTFVITNEINGRVPNFNRLQLQSFQSWDELQI